MKDRISVGYLGDSMCMEDVAYRWDLSCIDKAGILSMGAQQIHTVCRTADFYIQKRQGCWGGASNIFMGYVRYRYSISQILMPFIHS